MDRLFRGIGNRIRGVRDEEAAAGADDGREAASNRDITSDDTRTVIASSASGDTVAGDPADGEAEGGQQPDDDSGTDGDAGDEPDDAPLNQDMPPAGGETDASGGGLDLSTVRPIPQPTETDGIPGYVLRPEASESASESEEVTLDPDAGDEDAGAGTDDTTSETGSRREPVVVNEGGATLQTTEEYLASQGAGGDAGDDAEPESGGDVYLEPPPGAVDQEADEQPRDEDGEAGADPGDDDGESGSAGGDSGEGDATIDDGSVTVVWDDSSDSASDSVIINVGTGGDATSGGEEPDPDETTAADPGPVGTDVVTGYPDVAPDFRSGIGERDFSDVIPRGSEGEETSGSISMADALRRGIISAEDLKVQTNADVASNLPHNLNLAQDDEEGDDDDELIPAFLEDRIEIPEIRNEPEPGTGPPSPEPKVDLQSPQAEIVRSTLDLERASGDLDVMNTTIMAGDSEAGEPTRVIDPSRSADPAASGDPDLGPPMREDTLAGTAPDTAQPVGREALAGTAPDTAKPAVADVDATIDFQETLVPPAGAETAIPSAIDPPPLITQAAAAMPVDPLPPDDSGSVRVVEPLEVAPPLEDDDDPEGL